MQKKQMALELAQAGYAVFPLHNYENHQCSCGDSSCSSKGKHPRIANGSRGASRDLDQISQWWDRWPSANIALATGREYGVWVLDVDLREDRNGMLWLDVQDLPETVEVRTPTGGKHLYWAYPDDANVRQSSDSIFRGVDVRSDGGYVLVPPSDHQAGADYEWVRSLLGTPLPAPPQNLLNLVCSEIKHRAKGDRKYKISIGLDPFDAEEIRSALKFCDSDSRDMWLKVGMAIHSDYADEDGYHLWCEWSRSSHKFDAKVQRQTWDWMDSEGGITLDSLFFLAREGGWTGYVEATEPSPIPANVTEGSWDDSPISIADGVSDDLKAPASFPQSLLDQLHADNGLLTYLIQWINKSAIFPDDTFALAASLTYCSTLFGRRWALEDFGTRTNLYTLVIAPTAYGKNHARSCLKKLSREADLDFLLGGEDLGSGVGLHEALAAIPIQMFSVDEFWTLLRKINSPRAASWEIGIKSKLLTLYSDSDEVVKGTVTKGDRVDLVQPCCSLYATSTQQAYRQMQSASVVDGFLNRFILLEITGKRAPSQRPTNRRPPKWLVSAIRAAAQYGQLTLYEMFGADDEGKSRAEKYLRYSDLNLLKFTAGAESVWRNLERFTTDQLVQPGGAVYGRLQENAMKLAMLKCLCRMDDAPILSEGDAQWGAQLAQFTYDRLFEIAQDEIADNQVEAQLKQVLRFVKERRGWVDKSAISKALAGIPARRRNEILADLVESGQIEVFDDKTSGGRPKKRFRTATVN